MRNWSCTLFNEDFSSHSDKFASPARKKMHFCVCLTLRLYLAPLSTSDVSNVAQGMGVGNVCGKGAWYERYGEATEHGH